MKKSKIKELLPGIMPGNEQKDDGLPSSPAIANTHVVGSALSLVVWKDNTTLYVNGQTWEYENDENWLMTLRDGNLITDQSPYTEGEVFKKENKLFVKWHDGDSSTHELSLCDDFNTIRLEPELKAWT